MPKKIDISEIIGKKFGRWTPIKEVEPRMKKCGKKDRCFLCRCECGNEKEILFFIFKNGDTKSCGCYKKERIIIVGKLNTTHGETHINRTKEYRTWGSMKERCYNPKVSCYENYGGRGIKVCGRWLESYESFLEDMGRKPSPNHSIERDDVNGNYEPSNCRWATPKEQANNMTTNVRITYNGETKNIKQWSEYYYVNYNTLQEKLKKGINFIDAINSSKKNMQTIA